MAVEHLMEFEDAVVLMTEDDRLAAGYKNMLGLEQGLRRFGEIKKVRLSVWNRKDEEGRNILYVMRNLDKAKRK